MAQEVTLQERLGYSKDAKLLIIHADDLGVSHSENKASIYAMESGSVNSASIMVPCPWFPEIAEYAKNNPARDFGIHLTLTSEWKHLQWGPVSVKNDYPLTLVDQRLFFYRSVADFASHADLSEVRQELKAQIDRALDFGVPVTHLDTHMGALVASEQLTELYLSLGREYNLPVLMIKGAYEESVPGGIALDNIFVATPENFSPDPVDYYSNVLNDLKPGVSTILIHTAYDNEEMKAVCVDHPDYGSRWRQEDLDFFTSGKCEKLLQKNGIQLITWREIGEKLMNQ